jgi:DNA-binding MarR family transcriptional regulator/GNAT superfamily N-acetyltransferase
MTMTDQQHEPTSDEVAGVRHFNRFYTRTIGVLQEEFLHSPFSLTEGRVLYELLSHPDLLASEICARLDLDPGYVSRIVRAFEQRALLTRVASPTDARQQLLRLTPLGHDAASELDSRSRREVGAILANIPAPRRQRLASAMRDIEAILTATTHADIGPESTTHPDVGPAYSIRPPVPGDLGWIVHRQAVLYAQEYGWNIECEAFFARIVADFVQHFNPARERCWVAEREGEIVGSVFLVSDPEAPETTAKLRLLYVESSARGLGIGRRLVDECTLFARAAGYSKITLWTNSVLHAARRIYQSAGYQLVKETPHHSFGHDLVGQNWELTLV